MAELDLENRDVNKLNEHVSVSILLLLSFSNWLLYSISIRILWKIERLIQFLHFTFRLSNSTISWVSQTPFTPWTASGRTVTAASTVPSAAATSCWPSSVVSLWLSAGLVSSLVSPAPTSGTTHPPSESARSSAESTRSSWTSVSADLSLHAARLVAYVSARLP